VRETRGGVGKSSTKTAISLKHVKIEEKLLWKAIGTHQRSIEDTIPNPLRQDCSSPRLGIRNHPNTSIAIISGTDKDPDFKFGRYIHRVHPNKSPLKFGEK